MYHDVYFLQSKSFALDRTRNHLSKENQGYAVLLHDYYTTDQRYLQESLMTKYTVVYLNSLFVLLNAFVLLVLVHYSTKIYTTLGQLSSTPRLTSSIHKGALCTATAFVIIYLVCILVYDCTSGDFKLDKASPAYNERIKACIVSLCVRVSVLLTTTITYIGRAVYTIMTTNQHKIFKYKCIDVIVQWGSLMFCQLWIGVFLLPLVLYLIISPTITVFHISMVVLCYISLTMPVAYGLHQFKKNDIGLKCILNTIPYTTYYLVTLTLIINFALFYVVVMEKGAVPHGVQRLILSFIPSAILSLTIWIIKTRLFTSMNLIPHKNLKGELVTL